MKKIHWGHVTLSIAALVVAITALSTLGYSVERDINNLSQRPILEVGSKVSGRVAGVAVEQATIKIVRNEGSSISLDFEVTDGITAYQALNTITKQYGMELQTKEFDFGILVEGIGDLIGGQDDKYWSFYVNGEFALNSADNQLVNAGDVIEFIFQTNPF